MLFNANLELIGLAKLLKLLVKRDTRTVVIFINMDTTHRDNTQKKVNFIQMYGSTKLNKSCW